MPGKFTVRMLAVFCAALLCSTPALSAGSSNKNVAAPKDVKQKLAPEKKEKEEAKKLDEENKDMFTFMQEAIADKVKTVRLSKKLKTHPVCLSSDGSITIEMEKVLNAMPQNDGNKVKAEKALEINPNHPIFEKLKDLYANDKDKLKDYAKLLYDQALLIEGMSIDNPVEFANLVCDLMTK